MNIGFLKLKLSFLQLNFESYVNWCKHFFIFFNFLFSYFVYSKNIHSFFLFEKDTNCFLRSVINKCPLFFLIRGWQKLFEMYFVLQFCCPNVSKMFRAQSLNTIQTKNSKIQRKFLSEVNSKIIYHSLTTITVYLAIIV